MPLELTNKKYILSNKDIKYTMLEVQSHSGLPIDFFYPMYEMLCFVKNNIGFKTKELLNSYLNEILNKAMIESHQFRRKGVNKNLKSYDW